MVYRVLTILLISEHNPFVYVYALVGSPVVLHLAQGGQQWALAMTQNPSEATYQSNMARHRLSEGEKWEIVGLDHNAGWTQRRAVEDFHA